jgi:CzcA family heavy metal efflux pump
MWERLIRWSLDNRVIILGMAALVTAYGAWQASEMTVDVLPDVTAPTVTVLTEAHSMAPEEVEKQVTMPLENALQGVPGIRRLRSFSAIGMSIVWVEFQWDQDSKQARLAVSERLQSVTGQLPPGVAPPFIAPMTSVMGEIMFLGVTWDDGIAPSVARDVAEWDLRRPLLGIPGIAQIMVIGGDLTQYEILLRPTDMQKHGVTLDQVLKAMEGMSANAPGGFLVSGYNEYLIRAQGRLDRTEELAVVAVKLEHGIPVLLGQIATIHKGMADKRGAAAIDGKPAVVLAVQKHAQADTLVLTEKIEAALDDLAEAVPAGVHLYRKGFRQSNFIEVAISSVSTHILESGLLVLLILALFLANVRATVISLVALPVSLICGLLALRLLGQSVNTMTLGGIALSIGALVDDAVIDVENVFRRLRLRSALPAESRPSIGDTVLQASLEIRKSIVYATAVITVVFLPTFFLGGLEGRLLRPLGIAYVVTLLASLLVATTVTPVLCWLLLGKEKYLSKRRESPLVRGLKALYQPILRGVLRLPWGVVALALAATVGAAFIFMGFGRSFLPHFNEGSFTIAAATVPGASLQQSDALVGRLEKKLLELDYVTSVIRRTGRAERDEHAQDVQFSELEVTVSESAQRTVAIKGIREAASQVEGLSITVGQPISHRVEHMLSGVKTSIAIKIFGEDLLQLRMTAAAIKDAIQGVPGIADLAVEPQTDVPQVRIRPKLGPLSMTGLTPGRLAEMAETAFQGHPVGSWWDGDRIRELLVRFPPEHRRSVEDLEETLLSGDDGLFHRLGDLATVERSLGPNGIHREDGRRRIVVMANSEGRDARGIVEDIRAAVKAEVAVPDGYRVVYGGEYESQQRATEAVAIVALVAVAAMILLVWMAFGSFRDAIVVLLNLPLALIGGVITVKATGGILTIASMVGFITLFGIAARNGIMMISHYNHLLRHEGADIREAVLRGSAERLVPILMTALSAALALVPIALAYGEPGNEIQSPMAQVILGGLISSTLLNLVVVPAAYFALAKRRVWAETEALLAR